MSKKGKGRFLFEGLDVLQSMLRDMGEEGGFEEALERALYEGVSVVLKDVEAAIDAIPVRSGNEPYGTPEHPVKGLLQAQKNGLKASFGCTKMRNDAGFIHVKIGFDGYNNIKTKAWPNGQPNSMVARSIESGTSWMRKSPFMDKTVRACKERAELAIEEALYNEYYAIVH